MYATGTLTVDRLLSQHARIRPCDPAFTTSADGRTAMMTYKALDCETRRAAVGFERIGLTPGDRVIVLLDNGMPFAVAMLAAMRAGLVAIPVPTMSTLHELAYFVEHSRSRCIVSAPGYASLVAAFADDVSIVHTESRHAEVDWTGLPTGEDGTRASETHDAAIDWKSPALVLYTSGSTARPKGVMFSHEAVILSGLCNAWHQQLRPDDRHGVVLPMYHSNALFLQFWAALSVGASVHFGDRFDATTYWRDMAAAGVTIGNLVAGGIRALVGHCGSAVGESRMRFMLYGLALSDDEMAAFESRYATPLVMVYGLTETAACGTRSPVSLNRKADRVGLPMPGWAVRILDSEKRPVEPGVSGEVWLRGPAMFSGYLGQEDETRAVLHEGGMLTGDVAYFDADGFVVFVDRAKDLIKVNGRSVSPLEVEAVLRGHPAVAETAVIGVPDARTDERVVAFVVFDDAHSQEEVAALCREKLSYYKVPKEILAVSALPKTSVGKVRKNELARAYLEKEAGRKDG